MEHLKTLSLKTLFSGLPLFLILTLSERVNWAAALAIALGLTVIASIKVIRPLKK